MASLYMIYYCNTHLKEVMIHNLTNSYLTLVHNSCIGKAGLPCNVGYLLLTVSTLIVNNCTMK